MVPLGSRRNARGPGQPDPARVGSAGKCVLGLPGAGGTEVCCRRRAGEAANEQLTRGRKGPGPQTMRQPVRRWLRLPVPTAWHRAGLARGRPAPGPNGQQDTHWGQALGLGLLLPGTWPLPVCGDRPPDPQEMQIPPREARRHPCAGDPRCSGTTGPSRSSEGARSRERLRGGPGHCCRTRTKVLPVPSCPRREPPEHGWCSEGHTRGEAGFRARAPPEVAGSGKRALRLRPGGRGRSCRRGGSPSRPAVFVGTRTCARARRGLPQ